METITTLYNKFNSLTANNPFLTGGLVLGFLGGIVMLFRAYAKKTWEIFLSIIFTTIEVNQKDDAFYWVKLWMAEKFKHRRLFKNFIVSTKLELRRNYVGNTDEETNNQKKEIHLIPAPGIRFFFYKKRLGVLYFERKENNGNGANSNNGGGGSAVGFNTFEKIFIRFLFMSRKKAEDFISESYVLFNPDNTNIDLYLKRFDEFTLAGGIQPRNPDTLIYEDNIFDNMKQEVTHFFKNQSWYVNLGIPWRTGYILHGPPGNGKTSLIKTLAADIKANVYIVNLGDPSLTDGILTSMMFDVTRNSFIIFEDIDTIFNENREKVINSKDSGGITFSGLLNILDGITSPEGVVYFMTTNYIDKIDSALIRPGRIDAKILINNASTNGVRRMLNKFYPDYDFTKYSFDNNKHSLAHIQATCLLNKNKSADEVAKLLEN